MKVSQQWLENKIKELNDWLFENENHVEYDQKMFSRDYYVHKLIKLEKYELETIII